MKPLLHCFGHIHEGWGAEVVEWSGRADTKMTIEEYKDKGWEKSIKRVEPVDCGSKVDDRAVSVDGTALRRGRETVMVNAAIMDVGYRPVNAPFLVELELPKMQGLGESAVENRG